MACRGSDDQVCQDGDDSGEHDGGCELQAGCCLHRANKPGAEEIRRHNHRQIDERHERAEECAEEKRL